MQFYSLGLGYRFNLEAYLIHYEHGELILQFTAEILAKTENYFGLFSFRYFSISFSALSAFMNMGTFSMPVAM